MTPEKPLTKDIPPNGQALDLDFDITTSKVRVPEPFATVTNYTISANDKFVA